MMCVASRGTIEDMSDHAFRFGIVAGQPEPGADWLDIARRVEDLGYDVLLVPDTAGTLAPMVACAAAATATRSLRVGTHVLSAPNRSAAQVALETRALEVVSGGRFELGVGAGRPGAEREAAAFERPFGTAGERIDLVERVIHAVRDSSPDVPVMVAGRGRRMLQVAGRLADTVTFGLPPRAGADELAAAVAGLRKGAGARFDRIELAQNLLAVGDQAPPWLARMAGADLPTLTAAGSVAVLTGTPRDMADALQRRRDEFGITYYSTSWAFASALQPVAQLLSGR
jgi:probable F420-dependent oxidoreductase